LKFIAALAAELAALSALVDDSSADLDGEFLGLGRMLAVAVSSFCGFTMTIELGDQRRYTLTAFAEPATESAAIASSLRIPLEALSDSLAGSELIVYATVPGAFVDLAADSSWFLRWGLQEFVLDGHLDPIANSAGVPTFSLLPTVNQAIGFLIASGMVPEAAYEELQRRAGSTNTTVSEAAADVLRAAGGGPL
jgi:hypothetical protein